MPVAVLTPEELEELVTRAASSSADSVEELLVGAVLERLRPEFDAMRAELVRIRAANDSTVTIPEAARRLGRTVRHVQRCLRDGRLVEAPAVAGVRMVHWPRSE